MSEGTDNLPRVMTWIYEAELQDHDAHLSFAITESDETGNAAPGGTYYTAIVGLRIDDHEEVRHPVGLRKGGEIKLFPSREKAQEMALAVFDRMLSEWGGLTELQWSEREAPLLRGLIAEGTLENLKPVSGILSGEMPEPGEIITHNGHRMRVRSVHVAQQGTTAPAELLVLVEMFHKPGDSVE